MKIINEIPEVLKYLQNPQKYNVYQIAHCLDKRESWWTVIFKNDIKINFEKTNNVTVLYEDGKIMSWGQDFIEWAPELIKQ